MQRLCVGSMDKSQPKEIMWKTFPHRLFFARDDTATWGPGGVAFLHPESDIQEKTYLRLYKITYAISSSFYHKSSFSGSFDWFSAKKLNELKSILSYSTFHCIIEMLIWSSSIFCQTAPLKLILKGIFSFRPKMVHLIILQGIYANPCSC